MKTGYEFIDKVNNLVDLNNNESEPSIQDINLKQLTIPELRIGSKTINNSAPCRVQEFNEVINNFNKTSAIVESRGNTNNKVQFLEDDEILFSQDFLEKQLTGDQTYKPILTFTNQNCVKGGFSCITVTLTANAKADVYLSLEVIDTDTQETLKTFQFETDFFNGQTREVYCKFYYGNDYNRYTNKNLTLKFYIRFYEKAGIVNQITFQNRQFIKNKLEGLKDLEGSRNENE